MKTPTLIVRLIGIYLFVKSWAALAGYWQARRVFRQMFGDGAIAVPDKALEANLWIGIGMFFVGFLIARFAGPLARVLTYDSEAGSRGPVQEEKRASIDEKGARPSPRAPGRSADG